MPRDLPHRPSLEHFKKQAKARLRKLRTTRPHARLADAQHDVAREYGFASWPKLRAHLLQTTAAEAASAAVREPSFGRFTSPARRALFYSRYEAARMGSAEIAPEHLLIGLLRERQGTAERQRVTLTPADVRDAIARFASARPPLPNERLIPFDSAARVICLRASELADRLGHTAVATVHLLLGIAQDPTSMASRILADRGVSYDALWRDVAAGNLTAEEGQ